MQLLNSTCYESATTNSKELGKLGMLLLLQSGILEGGKRPGKDWNCVAFRCDVMYPAMQAVDEMFGNGSVLDSNPVLGLEGA
jgi:hypothetical protein